MVITLEAVLSLGEAVTVEITRCYYSLAVIRSLLLAPILLEQMSRLPSGLSKYGISPIWWGYRTPREIVVADVPTAVLYRTLQFVILLTTCTSLFESNNWAYSEVPDATANIWVDPTDAYATTLKSDYSSCQVSHSGPAEGLPAEGQTWAACSWLGASSTVEPIKRPEDPTCAPCTHHLSSACNVRDSKQQSSLAVSCCLL